MESGLESVSHVPNITLAGRITGITVNSWGTSALQITMNNSDGGYYRIDFDWQNIKFAYKKTASDTEASWTK